MLISATAVKSVMKSAPWIFSVEMKKRGYLILPTRRTVGTKDTVKLIALKKPLKSSIP